jgi:hypothetical protein
MTKQVNDVTYLYTPEMKYSFCRYEARLEMYFINSKISYHYSYVVKGAFFDRQIIDIIKCTKSILLRTVNIWCTDYPQTAT